MHMSQGVGLPCGLWPSGPSKCKCAQMRCVVMLEALMGQSAIAEGQKGKRSRSLARSRLDVRFLGRVVLSSRAGSSHLGGPKRNTCAMCESSMGRNVIYGYAGALTDVP